MSKEILIEKVSGWSVISQLGFDELVSRHPAKLFGSTNVAPSGFREVTEAEFVQDHDHTCYPELATMYNQIHYNNDGEKLPRPVFGNMFINGMGKGYMIEKYHQEKKAKFYFFQLCDHKYETIEKSMCWWKGKCAKCGMTHSIDSSD